MRVVVCLRRVFSALLFVCVLAGPGASQDAAASDGLSAMILVVDRARMFAESAFGLASIDRERIAAKALEDENAAIQSQLIAQEQELTVLRQTMSAAEFSVLAAAFDEKVERIRSEQDTKARDLARVREEDGVVFQRAALPVLGELMASMGGQVLLDKSAVILSLNTVDVTDKAIAAVDAALDAKAEAPVAP